VTKQETAKILRAFYAAIYEPGMDLELGSDAYEAVLKTP